VDHSVRVLRVKTSSNQSIKIAPPQSTQQEGRIASALAALKQGQFSSIRDAAKSYNIPYTTLHRRVNGRLARRDTRPLNCKLTNTEESTLVQ
jgi:hypothetical protein